jgi:hypothetical protein
VVEQRCDRRCARQGRSRISKPSSSAADLVAFPGFGSDARLAAGLVALLIAIRTVAALLLSARVLHRRHGCARFSL